MKNGILKNKSSYLIILITFVLSVVTSILFTNFLISDVEVNEQSDDSSGSSVDIIKHDIKRLETQLRDKIENDNLDLLITSNFIEELLYNELVETIENSYNNSGNDINAPFFCPNVADSIKYGVAIDYDNYNRLSLFELEEVSGTKIMPVTIYDHFEKMKSHQSSEQREITNKVIKCFNDYK